MCMPITEDYVSSYIEKKGITLDTKTIRTKAGVDKRKLSRVVASKVAIDIAIVVRVVPNAVIDNVPNDAPNDVHNESPEEVKEVDMNTKLPAMPRLKKSKGKKTLYIPRRLEVNVLNPVMTLMNKSEHGISYTTSSVNPIGSVILDMEHYIELSNVDITGKFEMYLTTISLYASNRKFSFFIIDIDENECSQISILSDVNNCDEYLNTSLNLGKFNYDLKFLFATKIPTVYGFDKNVLGQYSQLFVPTRKGGKAMKSINSSEKLRNHLTKLATDQALKKDKPGTFEATMAFGCATDYFISDICYFDEEPEELFIFSQNKPQELKEKKLQQNCH